MYSSQDRNKKLYNWMEKRIALRGRGYTLRQNSPKICGTTSSCDGIHKLAHSPGSAGVLVSRVGKKLPEILRGEVDPSPLVSDDILDEYYKTSQSLIRNYAQAALYVDLLAHQNPHLRILKIGAGTGGATAAVLETLGGSCGRPPRFLLYDYIDISGGFFENSKVRFAAWGDLLIYEKLDIEKDPLAQGFKGEDYDLVIAANILHVTRRVEDSLQNVRKLLKSNGKLLLIEESVETLHRFPFAISPGWWLGEALVFLFPIYLQLEY